MKLDSHEWSHLVIAIAVVLNGVGLIVLTIALARRSGDPEPAVGQAREVVEAREFVLVDEQGKVWARLGFAPMGKIDAPGLYLYDKNGTTRLACAQTGWGTGIRLCDREGRCALAFTDRKYWATSYPYRQEWPDEPPLGHPSFDHRTIYPQEPVPADWFADGPPAN